MVAQAEKAYSIEEYLERELQAETRSEYRNGEIVPMTVGSPDHNDIAGNLYILLKTVLRKQSYRIFYADQRLWISAANLYTYPDVMVVPTPLALQEGRRDMVTDPYFIAEVLSKSTQNYDRGEKFMAYRSLPNFQEYLLVDQYRVHVEHYVKQGDRQWLFSEYDNGAIELTLAAVDLALQVAHLYENIDFVNDEA